LPLPPTEYLWVEHDVPTFAPYWQVTVEGWMLRIGAYSGCAGNHGLNPETGTTQLLDRGNVKYGVNARA